MLKKDIKAINKVFIDERECGHAICDFDDYDHDLREIADVIGVEMVENEEEELVFRNKKEESRVKEALNYYYELYE